MKRRDAIAKIMSAIDDELVLCNIGFPSRELYDIDDRNVSSIGLGLALAKPNKKIVIIDGDGSFLMNLGSVITTFAQNPSNLTWIVINNEAYGSTGNQETYAKNLNLKEMAKSVGIKNCYNYEEIDLNEIINNNECNFICFNTEPGNSPAPIIDLTPIEIKKRFMKSI